MSYPSYEKQYHHDLVLGDKTIKFTIGKFSEQVNAAVLTQCGDTVVHTTVALGRPVNLDYFPLSVEFEEKLYSSGMIKGSRWVKRESSYRWCYFKSKSDWSNNASFIPEESKWSANY